MLAAMLAAVALTAFSFNVQARKMTVVNNCSYTLWPALYTSQQNATRLSQKTGWEAAAGSQVSFDLPEDWEGEAHVIGERRLWGRTDCDFSGTGLQATLPSTCVTGGCNGGLEWGLVYLHARVSAVDGTNIPLAMYNTQGCKSCLCRLSIRELSQEHGRKSCWLQIRLCGEPGVQMDTCMPMTSLFSCPASKAAEFIMVFCPALTSETFTGTVDSSSSATSSGSISGSSSTKGSGNGSGGSSTGGGGNAGTGSSRTAQGANASSATASGSSTAAASSSTADTLLGGTNLKDIGWIIGIFFVLVLVGILAFFAFGGAKKKATHPQSENDTDSSAAAAGYHHKRSHGKNKKDESDTDSDNALAKVPVGLRRGLVAGARYGAVGREEDLGRTSSRGRGESALSGIGESDSEGSEDGFVDRSEGRWR
ncbi:Osmotin, thaumatin-like protein [Meredithblackwellia eburnea MCA 4105]